MEHDFITTLERIGAIKRDSHFVYDSWLHGSVYVDKNVLFREVEGGKRLDLDIGRFIAERYKGVTVDAVIGPAKGGNTIAQWVKDAITCNLPPSMGFEPVVFETVDVDDKARRFDFREKRGNLLTGKKVLLVEDIIHTGGSISDVVWLVREHGGEVVAIETLCNRGSQTAESMNVPFLNSLLELPTESYEEGSCPLCDRGIPIDKEVGRGREYLERLSVE